mmetsp:Transcript_82205/g.145424  ORF Transcript_82205/g.145424 Transcript_82205/m.145424 type:complete len:215 (-) Transcript_82205:288-932(-)
MSTGKHQIPCPRRHTPDRHGSDALNMLSKRAEGFQLAFFKCVNDHREWHGSPEIQLFARGVTDILQPRQTSDVYINHTNLTLDLSVIIFFDTVSRACTGQLELLACGAGQTAHFPVLIQGNDSIPLVSRDGILKVQWLRDMCAHRCRMLHAAVFAMLPSTFGKLSTSGQDRAVACATAEVAIKMLLHSLASWTWRLLKQGIHAHDPPRGTVATL